MSTKKRHLVELLAHEREEIKRLNRELVSRDKICKRYSISPKNFHEITRENHDVY